MNKPLWLVKLIQFEYWTWWHFYMPLMPYHIWQSVRSGSFTYFTNVNECFSNGGFFETEKSKILEKINPIYLPKTILINSTEQKQSVFEKLKGQNFSYPIIAKPNIGERGSNVAKINNQSELEEYLAQKFDFLIQEYIDFEHELAILYVRYPNEANGMITSVTSKEYLNVTGDGKSTILELMQKNTRAKFQINRLKNDDYDLNQIIPKGKNKVLEPIGNHCRGTKFIDSNNLINNRLASIFDEICLPIKGFHYGRFDLKVKSIEDLYLGKNIKIMELNGVNSDAAHIFDPNFKLIQAYKDVAKHLKILANISIIQSKKGIKPVPFISVFKTLVKHFA